MAAVLTHTITASPSRLLRNHVDHNLGVVETSRSRGTGRLVAEGVHTQKHDLRAVPRTLENAERTEDINGQPDAHHESQEVADDDGEDENVNAVKIPPRRRKSYREEPAARSASALEDEASGSDAEAGSDESSSNAETEWEADSDAIEEEKEVLNLSHCFFCGQDEDHDPAEDFEVLLTCVVCKGSAHRQCARDSDYLHNDEDAESWHCPSCIANGAQAVDRLGPTSSGRRRSSAPQMTRDLLPAHRGSVKPGSHSVFNNLILDDDPLDGSRSLRKRKQSDEAEEAVRLESRKRQRRTTSEVGHTDTSGPAVEGNVETVTNLQPALQLPKSRFSRSRAHEVHERRTVRIVENSEDRLILCFHVESAKLDLLDDAEEKRKRKRRERDRARRARRAQEQQAAVPEQEEAITCYPSVQSTTYVTPFYPFHDRESDHSKSKPYGGILSEAEADTTRTFPQPSDRKRFEDARHKAEENWRKKMETANAAEVSRPSLKLSGPPSKIKCIRFGGYEIDTWHAAPYPEEYSRNKVLYICEFCLKYMNSDFVAWRHKLKCPAKHPPGDEIYRDGAISFFEIDGRKNPVYCQNLCLLAKLFLGSKTLYYDVEPFLFYVMTEYDEYGCHFVGYFSKEKRSSSQNNVSCILVLPIYQRRGFGHLLIEFSYLLTRVEKKTGSPEKPLSDMGLVSYRAYWRLILCYQLLNEKGPISVNDISDRTGMTADDIVCALEGLRALVRDPITRTYALRLDYLYFKQYIENYEKKGYVKLNPELLIWTPYVMGRDNAHYEVESPVHTIAQRDEADEGPGAEEVAQVAAQVALETAYPESRLDSAVEAAAHEMPTPTDESDKSAPAKQTEQFPPFPPLPDGRSARKKSLIKSLSLPPQINDLENVATPIPPTRFEVFPPLPGTAGRRKHARPFGRGNRRSTPVRRALSYAESPSTTTRPTTTRKTRSKLAEMVNGASQDEEDAHVFDDSGTHNRQARRGHNSESPAADKTAVEEA